MTVNYETSLRAPPAGGAWQSRTKTWIASSLQLLAMTLRRIVIIVVSAVMLWARQAAAAKLDNPLKPDGKELKTIIDVIGRLVWAFPPAIGAAAFLFVVVAGFLMVTAYGNEEKIERAKSTLLYAGVGIGALAMAYIIIEFVIRIMTGGKG